MMSSILVSGFALLSFYPEIGLAEENTCFLKLTEPGLRSISGSGVSAPAAWENLIITSVLTGCAQDTPFVIVIEVRNSEGVTESLNWQSGNLHALERMEAGVSWIPAHGGNFELRAFVISGFDSPEVLSSLLSTTVSIAENPGKAVIAIPYDSDPTIQAVTFEPVVLKVVIGVNNTVVWTNGDKVSHKIAPDPHSPDGFEFEYQQVFLYPSSLYEQEFTSPGTYYYIDKDRDWMRGVIIVLPREAMDSSP